MSVITTATRWMDNRLNPIVLRELRQAVRSRVVVAMLMIFLAIQLGLIFIYVMTAADASRKLSLSAGSDLTAGLFGILIFACMIFVPMYTGLRLAFERRDAQCDLMFVTTISPGRAIRGKLLSAVFLTLLIYSACMPFLTFAYLLRGVDLPSLLLCLTIGFLAVVAATQIAVLFACIPMSIVLRVIISIGGIIIMALAASAIYSLYQEAQMFGLLAGGVFWTGLLVSALIGAMWTGLHYCLSVALLSPPSANRTLPVRIYIAGSWLVGLLVAGILWNVRGDWEFIGVWAGVMLNVLTFALLVAICERQEWGPRVRRHIPRRQFRWLAFLMFSGAAGGVLWCLVMMGLTLVVLYTTFTPRMYGPDLSVIHIFSAYALYGYAYCMTAVLLWRAFLAKAVPHRYMWVVCLMLLCVGLLGPMVASFLFASGWDLELDASRNILMAFTPVSLGMSSSSRMVSTSFVIVWSILATVLSIPWFVAQYRRFTPLDRPRGPAAVELVPIAAVEPTGSEETGENG